MNAKFVTGTDIGDVTINNASGAAAVNIQDGGNTITVDGTVTITPSGTQTVAISQTTTNNDVDANITNATLAVTQSGTWDEVGINDSGNTITVDGSGTAGTPAGGVLTVQGVTSMTALKVDGSAVTQPVSGTVTVTQA